jgi:hypothetical protein
MVGKPRRSGGARAGAGAPLGVNTGGAREGAGRPPGVPDATVRPPQRTLSARKWEYAEQALQYAEEMIERLVDLARNGESESARLGAMREILDRALGKAPQDVSAIRHAEVIYRSAEQIRQECIARGVPPVLLEHLKNGNDDAAAG